MCSRIFKPSSNVQELQQENTAMAWLVKKAEKRIHDENTEQFFSLSLLLSHIQLEPDTTKRSLLPSYSARLNEKKLNFVMFGWLKISLLYMIPEKNQSHMKVSKVKFCSYHMKLPKLKFVVDVSRPIQIWDVVYTWSVLRE